MPFTDEELNAMSDKEIGALYNQEIGDSQSSVPAPVPRDKFDLMSDEEIESLYNKEIGDGVTEPLVETPVEDQDEGLNFQDILSYINPATQTIGAIESLLSMLSAAPKDIFASVGKLQAAEIEGPEIFPGFRPPTGVWDMTTSGEDVAAAGEAAADLYPDALVYEPRSTNAQVQMKVLGDVVNWVTTKIAEMGGVDPQLIDQYGPKQAAFMTIDKSDMSEDRKNIAKNAINFAPEGAAILGIPGTQIAKKMFRGGPSDKGPTPQTDAAAKLKRGDIDAAVRAADADPDMAQQITEFGLDPETDMPSSVFIREPHMRAVVEAAERAGDESPGQRAGDVLDNTLMERADEYINSMEFGYQGTPLRVGDEIPGAATRGGYSDKLQANLDTEATKYKDNIKANTRPKMPVSTESADAYLIQWLDDVEGNIADLPPELQGYSKRLPVSADRELINKEIARVGGEEKLSPGHKIYLRDVDAKEAAAEVATITYKQLQGRIEAAKDARIAAEDAGRGNRAYRLREYEAALKDDLATALDGIAGGELDSLTLAEQAVRSNELYKKGFNVRDTRQVVNGKELTTSIQEVARKILNRTLETGDLDALELLIKRIAESDIQHVDPKGRPQRYSSENPNYGLAGDVITDSMLQIVKGDNWLETLDAINSNSRLKRLVWAGLKPSAVKELDAFADFSRKVLSRNKQVLSKAQLKQRTEYIQNILDRALAAGSQAPWIKGGIVVRAAARGARAVIGRDPDVAFEKVTRIVASPRFQKAIRFAEEDKKLTPRVQNAFGAFEKLKVWKDYQLTLPAEVQTGILLYGLASYALTPKEEQE